mmetsp:Transcript_13630/g.39718  ORF Transcript_13630/g.39718 Transcript_13630/m.39718 type:complete len:354 (-) Transcript_13630:849-1910(-)
MAAAQASCAAHQSQSLPIALLARCASVASTRDMRIWSSETTGAASLVSSISGVTPRRTTVSSTAASMLRMSSHSGLGILLRPSMCVVLASCSGSPPLGGVVPKKPFGGEADAAALPGLLPRRRAFSVADGLVEERARSRTRRWVLGVSGASAPISWSGWPTKSSTKTQTTCSATLTACGGLGRRRTSANCLRSSDSRADCTAGGRMDPSSSLFSSAWSASSLSAVALACIAKASHFLLASSIAACRSAADFLASSSSLRRSSSSCWARFAASRSRSSFSSASRRSRSPSSASRRTRSSSSRRALSTASRSRWSFSWASRRSRSSSSASCRTRSSSSCSLRSLSSSSSRRRSKR